MPPRFSVVVPLYNKALSIGNTLASILAQTDADFELIVVDDGSTDGSAAIVAAVTDPRLRLLRQPNAGAGAARNRGIREARAPYVAFLDADDLWMPDFLSCVDALIGRFPGAALYATSYLISEGEGRLRRPRMPRAVKTAAPGLLRDYFAVAVAGEEPFVMSSICVDRAILERVGGFKPQVTHAEDLDFFARLALAGGVVFSPEAKAVYRYEAENRVTRCAAALRPWVFRQEFERLASAGALAPALLASLREYSARVDLALARTNLLNPDRRSLRAFVRNIRTRTLNRRRATYLLCSYLPVQAVRALLALHQSLQGLKHANLG